MFESPFWEILAGMAVCMLTLAACWSSQYDGAPVLPDRQFRARSLGRGHAFDSVARAALAQAMHSGAANSCYLRGLKQANWYWAPGEIVPPSPRAPFWNLETLWTEKYMGAAIYAGVSLLGLFVLFVFAAGLDGTIALLASLTLAAGLAYVGFTGPDQALSAAARRRQKQMALEMGFRLPELRSDVLAGRTVLSAMREMSRRPGGPFIEELRRVVLALDVLKDESAALGVMLDRNAGNEMVLEFINQMNMAVVQGNEVNRVLNVLTTAAQQRLLMHVQAQGRRNAAEMGRPLAMGSILILALLVMMPAVTAITATLR
jgi:hypothetical protein